MSLRAITAVLDWPIGGTAKIVVVGLADRATEDGRDAYPSVRTLARYANCSDRTVHRALRQLEKDGWIARDGVSRYGTTRWLLLLDRETADVTPDNLSGGDASDAEGVTPVSPNTSLEPEEKEKGARADTREPPTDRLDEVLAVLEAAPGLDVEPMSVLSAIIGHPDIDPVLAAHEVAMWAHEGGLRIRAAGRLLRAALEHRERHDANLQAIRQHAFEEESARISARRNGHTPRPSRQDQHDRTLADRGDELLAQAFATQQQEAPDVDR